MSDDGGCRGGGRARARALEAAYREDARGEQQQKSFVELSLLAGSTSVSARSATIAAMIATADQRNARGGL
jgi:hypothetical protein